ncbi:hypothetical protein HGB07_05700, partial [Candidatus Roizmanbacteria bacterium]|nr:hypothetical protein [Candidatus Roizmanbacteria bacterium]
LFQYRVYPTSNSLKDPKKTFFLTFRARIKGITRWGYKPSFKGMIVNILQFIIVSLLPSKTILALYEMMRFRRTLTLWEMVTSARAVSK